MAMHLGAAALRAPRKVLTMGTLKKVHILIIEITIILSLIIGAAKFLWSEFEGAFPAQKHTEQPR
jgi:hypothetical protein